MLLMTSQHPQRRRRSRPRSDASAVGAKRRALTDDGAEGIRPQMLRPLLSIGSSAVTSGCCIATFQIRFSPNRLIQ